METPIYDFKCCVIKWSTSRRRFSSQLETLRSRVQEEQPDLITVVDIPRHHVKKVCQQSWTNDYYLSKESRTTTEQRSPVHGKPTLISVIWCRFPFHSEQWFPLKTNNSNVANIAHIAEVCLPLNAWHPDRSPLGLLQEYQLTYDEVSMLTFVIATNTTDILALKETFAPEKMRNVVLYVLSPEAVVDEQNQVKCGSSHMLVEFQAHPSGLWRVVDQGKIISLASTLGSLDLDDQDDPNEIDEIK